MPADINCGEDVDFHAVFAGLRDDVEAAVAGRARLSVKHYSGTGGIHVVCQEAFHHNFDLTHEHWADVIEPCLEQDQSTELFLRKSCQLAFAHVLLTGDKAAGKTTFLNGLTTGDLRILQCLRYESAQFYNIWYAPSASDLAALRKSLRDRALPFFQTELAHGVMLMDAPELKFFLEDDEFAEGEFTSPATAAVLDAAQHVMVKILELGGDCLHELLQHVQLDAPQHPVKAALLQQTAASVRMAGRVAYFVNLESLFSLTPKSDSAASTADSCGAAVFVERLRFLKQLLQEDAEVSFFCTKPPSIDHSVAVDMVARTLSLSCADSFAVSQMAQAEGSLDTSSCPEPRAQMQLQIVHWLAAYAGLNPSSMSVFAIDHLCDDGSTNHSAILQSLRRLLGGDPLNTAESALLLLMEQVAHVLLDNRVACVDRDTLAELLLEFEDSGHAELYWHVVHPMVVIPSMVLLDAFFQIMPELSSRGLAHPADHLGKIHLDVTINSDSCWVQLCPANSGDCASEVAISWRCLVQSEVVAEARKALNLFQLEGRAPIVPQRASINILSEAWASLTHAWSVSPIGDAFNELFLAARFLLLTGHEALPEAWALNWTDCSTERGVAKGTSITVQVPYDIFQSLPCQPKRVRLNES